MHTNREVHGDIKTKAPQKWGRSNVCPTYNDKVNPKELFLTSIVYGASCGIAGTPPEYQDKLMVLLRAKDYKTLLSWLRSPNTEKQLYALIGLKL